MQPRRLCGGRVRPPPLPPGGCPERCHSTGGSMSGDGFPGAEWIPAHPQRYRTMTSRTIDAIVLHCTDGKAVDARQTARNAFGSPPEVDGGGHKHSQSAHYIVGRDGAVVQCVRHKDIAWHANAESLTTIGIEHN